MCASVDRRNFERRVSFNNLYAEYIDDDTLYGRQSSYQFTNNGVNLGNGEIKLNSTRRRSSFPGYLQSGVDLGRQGRSGSREGPGKLILRNKFKSEEAEDALLQAGAGDESLQSFGEVPWKEGYLKSDTGLFLKQRRKLLSDMSDEEVLALDPQYVTTKSRVSNVKDYKFDMQPFFYNEQSKRLGLRKSDPGNVMLKSPEENYSSLSLTKSLRGYYEAKFFRTLLLVLTSPEQIEKFFDWLIRREPGFLIDGDHLVVPYLIPKSFEKQVCQKKSFEDVFARYGEKLLARICDEIPESDLKLKITLELVADKTSSHNPYESRSGYKYMISRVFKQYQPMLIVVDNKSKSLNFKYNLQAQTNSNIATPKYSHSTGPHHVRSFSASSYGSEQKRKYLIKLSSYIIKHSPVPVILIGNISATESSSSSSDSDGSAVSLNSFSEDSVESLKVSLEHSKIHKIIGDLTHSDSVFRFKDMLALVSDKSKEELQLYIHSITSSQDYLLENGPTHSSIHSAYMSQQSSKAESNKYKVKCLLTDDDTEKEKKPQSGQAIAPVSKSPSPNKESTAGSKLTKGTTFDSKKSESKMKSFLQKLGFKK